MLNRRRLLGIGSLLFVLWVFVPVSTTLAATLQFGFKDQSFSGAASAPSGSKPESKLWYADGTWWGSMWSSSASAFRIFRLNGAGSAWTDTGVTIDTRSNSRADALWDGSKLYIASHEVASDSSHNTAGRPGRLYRFSYDSGSKTYSLDAGFPAQINTIATETLVIDKDSTGTIWATWTQGKAVKVAHTAGSDTAWSAPITPAVTGASAMSSDDVSSLVRFGGNRIGVMWSNQSTSHMYFSTHVDGTPDTAWTASEAATSGSGSADDHINLKTDSAGRVYAAVKTSLTSSSATLTQLLVRSTGGSWTASRFGTVAGSNTRPIVLIDEANGLVHMFATGPYPGKSSGQSGGTIYEKTAPLNAISFTTGTGTPIIQDPTSADMNDASSTKQNVTSASGIVVIATNDSKDFYWHGTESVGNGSGTAPTADFTGSPLSGAAPLGVSFSDASSDAPTAWSWNFGDPGSGSANTSTSENPSHTYATAGTYTVSLTASNAFGDDTKTRTGYITVGDGPVASFTGSPTSGDAPLGVEFSDASTGSPTAWSWDFGDPGSGSANQSNLADPSHTYAADGAYTVKLTVTNDFGQNTQTRTSYIHVGNAPIASFDASPTAGDPPLLVSFTDTSANNPTGWSWNFGDPSSGAANTSTLENPTHTYSAGGTYTVSLTASNGAGSDVVTRTGLISVTSSESTLTLEPTADSYVSSSNLNGNYGSLATMKVREGDGSSANPNYRTYLKFNVSGVGPSVTALSLRLFITDASSNVESVYVVGDSSWGETTISYNNAPAISGTAIGTTKSAPAGAYVTITLDPTAFPSGASTLTLALKSSSTDSLIVSSRDDPTNPPELVVTSH
ncbi:MAG TPA: PKD domain-containing protein [Candidatus Limnocylindrales bacterium]|nr:PKD domain-containing protein [Candidatus Limnocylindrales bacterium]